MNDPHDVDPQASPSPKETPTADLLSQIISATERQLSDMEIENVPAWDVAATEFFEKVRRLDPGWSDDRAIVWGMVESAIPTWARSACTSRRAQEELVDGVAQTLWMNPRSRAQIVSLYQRLRSRQRGDD